MFDSLTQRMVTLEDSHREILGEFKSLLSRAVNSEAAAEIAAQNADPLSAMASAVGPSVIRGMFSGQQQQGAPTMPQTPPRPSRPQPTAQEPVVKEPGLSDIFSAIADDAETLEAGMKVLSKLKNEGFDFSSMGIDPADIETPEAE